MRSLVRALFCSREAEDKTPLNSEGWELAGGCCTSGLLPQLRWVSPGERTLLPGDASCWGQAHTAALSVGLALGDCVCWAGLQEQRRGTALDPAPVAKAALGEKAQ